MKPFKVGRYLHNPKRVDQFSYGGVVYSAPDTPRVRIEPAGTCEHGHVLFRIDGSYPEHVLPARVIRAGFIEEYLSCQRRMETEARDFQRDHGFKPECTPKEAEQRAIQRFGVVAWTKCSDSGKSEIALMFRLGKNL